MPARHENPDATAPLWRRAVSPALTTIAVLAVLVGLGLADRRAGAIHAESSPMVRFNWAEARIGESVTVWPPSDVQAALDDLAQAALRDRGGPLSVEGLAEIGRRVTATGWVERVRSVNRTGDGTIRVEVEWRPPAAVVRQAGRDHLVSGDGRRMRYAWQAGASPFPAVLGADRLTPAESVPVGAFWPDTEVLSGVELIVVLHQELGVDPVLGPGGFDQVRGVDVRDARTAQRLVILTDTGSRVIWGRPPSDPVPDPVSTSQKLRKLAYLRRHPDYDRRIDAGQTRLDLSTGPILVDDRRVSAQNDPSERATADE